MPNIVRAVYKHLGIFLNFVLQNNLCLSALDIQFSMFSAAAVAVVPCERRLEQLWDLNLVGVIKYDNRAGRLSFHQVSGFICSGLTEALGHTAVERLTVMVPRSLQPGQDYLVQGSTVSDSIFKMLAKAETYNELLTSTAHVVNSLTNCSPFKQLFVARQNRLEGNFEKLQKQPVSPGQE